MAEWNKNKVDPSEINKGQEFINGDNLARDELNAIVNNSFYASEKAQRAEQLAESAVRGNGTLVTIGGQVQGEWSADFAESERQKSKNLFNKEAVTKGVELVGDTGEERTAELYWVSEYINIQGMSALYCSGTRTSGTSFCYYSEDKTFISTQRLGEWVGQLTPPTNAVYLRFNGLLTELDDIQLEKGTVATDYQPYAGGQIARFGDIVGLKGTVLWKNPDTSINVPGTKFESQTITLNSNDYDEFEMIYYMSSSNSRTLSVKYLKGEYGVAMCGTTIHSSGAVTYVRNCNVTDNYSKVFFENAWEAKGATAEVSQNTCCIPLKIIGYKRS